MHLNSETDNFQNFANENKSRMSNSGLDNRLRRQVPVTAKPPRLRLGIRGLSSHPQQSRKPQPDTSSCIISSRNSSQVSSIIPDGGYFGRKGYHPPSIGSNENLRAAVSNGNRPLIHHQRHNLKNRFQLLKTLGEGTYGKVKLAADKSTGEHVAIKYIKKTKIEDENDLIRIRREIQILSSLRHKHIVNIREVFERKDKIVLVLDYAQGGELYDYLNRMGKLPEIEARRIFRQIVSAIHYCHQNGIVHRDLKLENIILDDEGNVKIADFGLSNYYSHNNTLITFCGSPLYASPEIVNGKPYHGPEVDVWSLGVILYTLVYGSMPFESNNLVSLKQQISEGDYSQPSKLSDAAGLIRHMLTVTPSRRASIDDALRHWWINLGHTYMPNDMPYSPDDEPPTIPHCVAAGKRSLNSTLDPPPVIHHRNQSSISSDSDVELDFKPNRWSKRTILLDSTGNSVSSSVAGSPDPTPESYRQSAHESSDDPAAIISGLLKLPPDVLEILKGCSSKSLAALLKTDKISSGFDLDMNSNSSNTSCQTNEEENTEDSTESDKTSSSVFDSERKPKRGILKRKGKFSGYDSGCIMQEEITVELEDIAIPKSGHLPRRLPSFRDEAHGIFASKHRASQLLDPTFESLHQESCSGAAPHTGWSYPTSSLPELQHQQRFPQTRLQDKPQDIISMQAADSQCLTETVHKMSTDITTTCFNGNTSSETEATQSKQESEQDISAKSSPGNSSSDLSNKEPTKVIYRPKSILKKSSFDEGKNRLSISSIGSNSSADILDLSYDSGDNDHFINRGGSEHSLDVEVNTGHAHGHIADDIKSSSQRSYSFDEGLLGHHASAASSDLSHAGRHRSLSHEGQQLLDSTSLMSRLSVDAQSLH